MRKLALSVLLSALLCLISGAAESECLQVGLDEELGITIECWKINGVYYDVTFEFATGVGEGGVYWKIKTLTPANDCECTPAPLARTGQQWNFEEKGADGDLRKGIHWPNPRFEVNNDGTVTDKLTGLIWLKDAGCFQPSVWSTALFRANNLKDGQCGLSDGSVAGDWRLPNVKELYSLIHPDEALPALSDYEGGDPMRDGDPFTNVYNGNYWTSTSFAPHYFYLIHDDWNYGLNYWYVDMGHGRVNWNGKFNSYRIWPVRGGE